jgi:hypothetical protein
MRLSRMAIVGILLSLAALLAACGEDGTTAASRPTTTAAQARPGTTAKSLASAGCRRQLGGFLGSLSSLRRGLVRGLSYDQYLHGVKAIRPAYAGIDAKRLPAGCLLAVGGPAERAFDLYIDAANTWGDCLSTVTCSTRTIEPKLQHRWALASRQLALAGRGLD